MIELHESQMALLVENPDSEGLVLNEESAIAGAALAFLGSDCGLSAGEKGLLCHDSLRAEYLDAGLLSSIENGIRRGEDPLGKAFLRVRSSVDRRPLGAVYTPDSIVKSMVAWSATSGGVPCRVVDAGAGSGRFISEAAKHFPQADLHAVEIDPLATLILRVNARICGFESRLTIHTGDYCDVSLPCIDGSTLFIGNPPYVRHHGIDPTKKAWYAKTAAKFGLKASGLAGLHLYFYLKTLELSRCGDFGIFITAAEWMDVNYGHTLRSLLEDQLGASVIHLLSPEAAAFEDAITTAAIVGFRVGNRSDSVKVRMVKDCAELSEFGNLAEGRDVRREQLRQANRWSPVIRGDRPMEFEHIELGELFNVHRGQVTGANAVWVQGKNTPSLPEKYLYPAVTRARELFDADGFLRDSSCLRRVIDLPKNIDGIEEADRELVDRFLVWAKQQGVEAGYVARSRPAWWSVGLKPPPPIVCTYMARRPPAFVFNCCQARLLNIAHGLYPRSELKSDTLLRLMVWLNNNLGTESGRAYAGGLIKFEPREIQRIKIPKLDILHDATDEMVARSA